MFIIEIIIEAIFVTVLEVLGQIILELGLGSLVELFRRKKEANLILVFIGLTLLGALFGFVISYFFTYRIIRISPLPGLSLILSPLLAGFCMEFFGRWRKSKGKEISNLATFWGGALFAFSAALMRFCYIGGFV